MVDYGTKLKNGAVIVGVAVLVALAVLAVLAVKPLLAGNRGTVGQPTAADAAVYELVLVGSEIEHQTIDDFKSFISSTDQPVFVDFWAEWCAPCQKAAPAVEALASEFSGQAHIVKINVDYAQDLASLYHVSGIPHFAVLKGGKVIDTVTGYGAGSDDVLRALVAGALAN